jgi:hypothetical protein
MNELLSRIQTLDKEKAGLLIELAQLFSLQCETFQKLAEDIQAAKDLPPGVIEEARKVETALTGVSERINRILSGI